MLNIISQNHLCRRRLFETTEGAKSSGEAAGNFGILRLYLALFFI